MHLNTETPLLLFCPRANCGSEEKHEHLENILLVKLYQHQSQNYLSKNA